MSVVRKALSVHLTRFRDRFRLLENAISRRQLHDCSRLHKFLKNQVCCAMSLSCTGFANSQNVVGEKIFASVEVYGFLTISIESFVRTDRSARLLYVDLHGLAKVKIGSRSAMFAFCCLLIIGCNYRKSEKACKKQTMIIFVPRLSLYFFIQNKFFSCKRVVEVQRFLMIHSTFLCNTNIMQFCPREP